MSPNPGEHVHFEKSNNSEPDDAGLCTVESAVLWVGRPRRPRSQYPRVRESVVQDRVLDRSKDQPDVGSISRLRQTKVSVSSMPRRP